MGFHIIFHVIHDHIYHGFIRIRSPPAMWGPQDSEVGVHITPISLCFLLVIYRTSFHGVYKPTYNWGAPSCMCFFNVSNTAHVATLDLNSDPFGALEGLAWAKSMSKSSKGFLVWRSPGSRNLTDHILPPISKAARIQSRLSGREGGIKR